MPDRLPARPDAATSLPTWRTILTRIDPVAARAPASHHAARLLLSRGHHAAAEAAFRELLSSRPDDLPALRGLGVLLRQLGREAEAASTFERAALVEAAAAPIADADRPATARFFAAAERCGPVPAVPPAGFIAAHFDAAADRFDTLLRDRLGYRAPELLLEAVRRTAGPDAGPFDILDLGCGTGLVGERFRPIARWLDGVDLSANMLKRAAERGVYDRLDVGDVVEHLAGCGRRYDLILAADVFIYIGDLAPVLAAARLGLRPGGRLAFTVEAGAGDDYQLLPVRRYAHSPEYIARVSRAAGMAVREIADAKLRTEATVPVPGHVVTLTIGEPGAA